MSKIEYEDGKNDYLSIDLPMELNSIFQNSAEKLYKHTYYKTQVVKARLSTTRNAIPSALTSIRSRLLSFCMKIMDTFGDNIEIESFNQLQKTNNEQIVNIMNTTINNHGDGNVLNTGEDAKIHASININKGKTQELTKKLADLGIDAIDIGELDTILENEKPDKENKKLGNKAIDWISKISGKAPKGAGSIAKEVTSSVLANILKQYCGFSQND